MIRFLKIPDVLDNIIYSNRCFTRCHLCNEYDKHHVHFAYEMGIILNLTDLILKEANNLKHHHCQQPLTWRTLIRLLENKLG